MCKIVTKPERARIQQNRAKPILRQCRLSMKRSGKRQFPPLRTLYRSYFTREAAECQAQLHKDKQNFTDYFRKFVQIRTAPQRYRNILQKFCFRQKYSTKTGVISCGTFRKYLFLRSDFGKGSSKFSWSFDRLSKFIDLYVNIFQNFFLSVFKKQVKIPFSLYFCRNLLDLSGKSVRFYRSVN